MATITGLQIRDALEKWGIIELLGTGTATAGGADRIRDVTRLQSISFSSTRFADCYVRLTGGTGAGEQSRVDWLDVDNGDLYVSPAFGAAPTATTTYEIFAPGVNPDDADRLRDEALTKLCSQWAYQVVSDIPNGDFEDDLAASNWVLGASATIAPQVLSFPREFARNSLLVTNAGANGRASSASMYVRPGMQFYIYAPVSIRSGTAELIVRDITNSADVLLSGSAVTAVGRGRTAIEATGIVPTNCYEIQVWLRGQEATAIVEWEPVNFHWMNSQRIGLPSRILSKARVGGLFYLYNHQNVSNGLTLGEEAIEEITGIKTDQIGDSVQMRMEAALTNRPYFFMERIFYTALQTDYQTVSQRTTGDAATTLCNLYYVTAATAMLIARQYKAMQPANAEFWQGVEIQASSDLLRYEREFGPKPRPRQERARSVGYHMLEV